jgi:hypothetical protein
MCSASVWQQSWCSENVQEQQQKNKRGLNRPFSKHGVLACVRACVHLSVYTRARVKPRCCVTFTKHDLSMFTARHASPRASRQGLRYQCCPRLPYLHLPRSTTIARRASAKKKRASDSPSSVSASAHLTHKFHNTIRSKKRS